jgi:hypothetical protein
MADKGLSSLEQNHFQGPINMADTEPTTATVTQNENTENPSMEDIDEETQACN